MANQAVNTPAIAASKAIPLQVVFQGGGAKISALMAVCAVLREYEEAGDIKITKVAGTSAGAIAAVMCASRKTSIGEFAQRLKSVAPKYLARMSGSEWWGYRRVIFGQPFFKNVALEDVFRDIFCPNPTTPQLLRNLDIETQIYSTNLYSLAAQEISRNEPIPTALAKSCKIPYFFAGFKSTDAEVDGGLALNLPVDGLKADESTLGAVIGIGFLPIFTDRKISHLLGYTEQLFSAAIQSNVNRSMAQLGDNAFSIDTKIGMLDFQLALDDGLDGMFRYVQLQFKSWFDMRLNVLRPKSAPARMATPFAYPILNNAPFATAVVEELSEHYRAEKFTQAVSMVSYDSAILNQDGSVTGKYKSRFLHNYKIKKKTRILSYDFQTGKSESTFSDFKLRVMVIDKAGDPLSFATHVQETTVAGQELRSFRIYLLFESALTPESPNQPLTIECHYEVDDFFPNLGKGFDGLSFTREDGDADEITIAVAFPRCKLSQNYKSSDLSTAASDSLRSGGFAPDAKMVPSHRLDPGGFIPEFGLTTDTKHYIFEVWRAENVSQGQTMGFLIR
ncbi:patatin-like phospholipase family protein [Bradyrhizobium sp.]